MSSSSPWLNRLFQTSSATPSGSKPTRVDTRTEPPACSEADDLADDVVGGLSDDDAGDEGDSTVVEADTEGERSAGALAAGERRRAATA